MGGYWCAEERVWQGSQGGDCWHMLRPVGIEQDRSGVTVRELVIIPSTTRDFISTKLVTISIKLVDVHSLGL